MEDQPGLVRLLLSHGGQADREGLPAGIATVALGARLGSAIAAVVGRATGDANGVVGALGVWADGVRGGSEVGAKAFALLDDPAVALQWWVLTAGEALQHRKLTTSADHDVAITLAAPPSGLASRHAIVRAARVLAEIDLDSTARWRDARPPISGRFFLHVKIPLPSSG
jgi:hypothetical protein